MTFIFYIGLYTGLDILLCLQKKIVFTLYSFSIAKLCPKIVCITRMNELPVIGSLLYLQRFATLGNRCEKMYGGNLFDVHKTILERDQRFFRHSFDRWQVKVFVCITVN